MAVISNGITIKQWEKLVRLNVYSFFDEVITSEEVGKKKPDKLIYDVALTFDEGDIINIYEKIQNKYPKRVNKETITNYIRSELTKDNQLSTQNIDFCINKLNILINE